MLNKKFGLTPPTLQKEKGLKLTVVKGYSEICINLFE